GAADRREHGGEVPPAAPPLRRARGATRLAADRQAQRAFTARDRTPRSGGGRRAAGRPSLVRRPHPDERGVRDYPSGLDGREGAPSRVAGAVISFSELKLPTPEASLP